ncbi:MAG: hypothetical protein EP338_00110 [Bacteroidetes bacterium]|nr:MAG: hypothetical protein EP338_00110 [Bacteroidota bacterium]
MEINENLYYRGQKFRLTDTTDGRSQENEFMLVETHEQGTVFQIVCIHGYDAGRIFGYIAEENEMLKENHQAISPEYFLKCLSFNFNYDPKTLVIIDD